MNYSLISHFPHTGFEDMDSVYATVSDVKTQQRKEEKQGLALLEYFVKQCNEAEVTYVPAYAL
jgi:hypothetical protein